MQDRAWQQQQALADQLKAGGLLNDPAIEAAFRAVPRHLFLPGFALEQVYSDDAIGTKFLEDGRPISSSSQPAIMAIMLDQLGLAPGQKVLEIGAGTGYNAALLAHIVGDKGSVFSADIDEDIVTAARHHLQNAGYERVQLVQADGFQGLPEYAPYDRIILTVGASDIAPAWWQQLKPDSRLVVPLELAGHSSMVSVAFEWSGDHLTSLSLRACGFMMLRGEGASGEYGEPIEGRTDLRLGPSEPGNIDAKRIAAELQKPVRDLASGVRAVPWQLERDIRFWLARSGLQCFALSRQRSGSPGGTLHAEAIESYLGVMREGALCVLVLDRPSSDPNVPGQVWVYRYGDAVSLANSALEGLRSWAAAGCPSAELMRVRAYPRGAPNEPGDAEIVVERKSVRLLLNWPDTI